MHATRAQLHERDDLLDALMDLAGAPHPLAQVRLRCGGPADHHQTCRVILDEIRFDGARVTSVRAAGRRHEHGPLPHGVPTNRGGNRRSHVEVDARGIGPSAQPDELPTWRWRCRQRRHRKAPTFTVSELRLTRAYLVAIREGRGEILAGVDV